MKLNLDDVSLLADVHGEMTLGEVERELAERELTLGITDLSRYRDMTVATWLEQGAPGSSDPWLDPADHLIAGVECLLHGQRSLTIRSAPRRAVGPDLIALVFGTRGRFGTILRASLRVQRIGVARPQTEPFRTDADPPVSEGEERLFTAIERELSRG